MAGLNVYCRMAPRAGPGATRPEHAAGRLTRVPVQAPSCAAHMRASTVMRCGPSWSKPTRSGAARALDRVPTRSLAGGAPGFGNGSNVSQDRVSGLASPPRTSGRQAEAALYSG